MSAIFEELIYTTLTNDTNIAPLLTTYSNVPAIFNRQAPDEVAREWGEFDGVQTCYPRMEFWITYFEDAERSIEGNLSLDITCEMEQDINPEDIEAYVKQALHSTFFETTMGVMALMFHRSDPAQYHKMNPHAAVDRWYKSITMEFNILGFPEQPIGEPNPIDAIMDATKSIVGANNAFFIDGRSSGTDVWKPLPSKPAIYWRAIARDVASANGSDLRYNISMRGHVLAANFADRFRYCSIIQDGLRRMAGMIMRDNSQFSISGSASRLAVSWGASSLTEGQIIVSGTYVSRDTATIPPPVINSAPYGVVNFRVNAKLY